MGQVSSYGMHEGQGNIPVILKSDGTSTFGILTAEVHDHDSHEHFEENIEPTEPD
jgi:hypothetical protein